jgi:hypothetical protein
MRVLHPSYTHTPRLIEIKGEGGGKGEGEGEEAERLICSKIKVQKRKQTSD